MSAGRFAPSPTGDLHIGNLRTALLAWLFARSTERQFLIRVEDLDAGRCRPEFETTQLADLAAFGLTSDQPIVRQSERLELYERALSHLQSEGLLYECFCTRREVLEAASAPHGRPGAYPGTCRNLSERERSEQRKLRPPAWRLRVDVESWSIVDELHGRVTVSADDPVVRRNDGIPSYNVAVVLDDAWQSIDQVVRGEDLLAVAPLQAHLAHVLGVASPSSWVHVPLALNPEGKRLAKRDGPVTLRDLDPAEAWRLVTESLGLVGGSPEDLLNGFDPATLPREPWVVRARAVG